MVDYILMYAPFMVSMFSGEVNWSPMRKPLTVIMYIYLGYILTLKRNSFTQVRKLGVNLNLPVYIFKTFNEVGLNYGWIMPSLTIFQFYLGGQLYWSSTHKKSHWPVAVHEQNDNIKLYRVHLFLRSIQTDNFSSDRH